MNNKTLLQLRLHQWLGGIKPAWRDLSPEVRSAFVDPSRIEDGPTIINENLSKEDLRGSHVANHAQLVLKAINDKQGVPLTQRKGNLTRKFVDEMVSNFGWPKFSEEKIREYNKVINEDDFTPLHFIHLLLRTANLLRKYRNKIVITKLGTKYLKDDNFGELQSVLFKALVNKFNIGNLDGNPLEGVIQPQFGLILYLISKEANDWINPDKLMRLTMIPIEELLMSRHDHVFEYRVIRYLEWFGLMEERDLGANDTFPREYEVRKTWLYDRFFKYCLFMAPTV